MNEIAVPPGHIVAVVTHLEMRQRPLLRAMPQSSLRLVRWAAPALEAYRTLFRRVGEPWLWYSRLQLDDRALAAAIHAEERQIHAVIDRAGIEVGMIELSHPSPNWCSLDFLGLVPEWSGRGEGRWLMANALALAWRPGVELVRVHTCTLDHPGALRFYQREGFVAVGREVEIAEDPRISGLIPADAAPQIPLITAPIAAQAADR